MSAVFFAMISRVLASAIPTKLLAAVLVVCPLSFTTCFPLFRKTATPSASPSPSPLSAREPLLAFLFEGQVLTVAPDGLSKPKRAGTSDEPVDEFLWSSDGNALYLVAGLRVVSFSIESGTSSELGVIAVPAGTTLDRLESSSRPHLIIVHASDADAAAHLYVFDSQKNETRELSVDEYVDLSAVESPTLRGFSELSVSPDLMHVMFKTAVGTSEQIFVADINKGYRTQLTELEKIAGFEESAESETGRRIIAASWSPDGKYILFNPAQSCSDSGLCYGQLFIIDSSNGAIRRLSQGMMVGLDTTWDKSGTRLLFEDAGKVMFTTPTGEPRVIAEGNRPRWQPRP